MSLETTLCVLGCILSVVSSLSCMGDDSAAKDWWLSYKHIGSFSAEWARNSSDPYDKLWGNRNYTYADNANPTPTLSKHFFDYHGGAAMETIKTMFDSSDVEYILFNDQDLPPYGPMNITNWKDGEVFGHIKGVLSWDPADGTGYWIVHSFPYFPCGPGSLNNTGWPGSSLAEQSAKYCNGKYGASKEYMAPGKSQTYEAQMAFCVSIGSMEEFNQVAENYVTGQPVVYDTRVSQATLSANSGISDLANMAYGTPVKGKFAPMLSSMEFNSAAKTTFTAFQSGASFNNDVWSQVVQPALKEDISVSTWYEGCPNLDTGHSCSLHSSNYPLYSDCHMARTGETEWTQVKTLNISFVALSPMPYGSWLNHWNEVDWCPWDEHHTSTEKCAAGDHSKWAVSETTFCIGDNNRSPSQEIRGGGALCFEAPQQMLSFLHTAIKTYPCPSEDHAQKQPKIMLTPQ